MTTLAETRNKNNNNDPNNNQKSDILPYADCPKADHSLPSAYQVSDPSDLSSPAVDRKGSDSGAAGDNESDLSDSSSLGFHSDSGEMFKWKVSGLGGGGKSKDKDKDKQDKADSNEESNKLNNAASSEEKNNKAKEQQLNNAQPATKR